MMRKEMTSNNDNYKDGTRKYTSVLILKEGNQRDNRGNSGHLETINTGTDKDRDKHQIMTDKVDALNIRNTQKCLLNLTAVS